MHRSGDAKRVRAAPEMLNEDPRLDLHDGRFELVEIDRRRSTVTLVVNCGDLQLGYRRVSLFFENAEIVTPNLRAAAEAVGATFRSNRWHQTRTVTEIIASRTEVGADGRHRLRLRLDPFGSLTVAFGALWVEVAQLAERGAARPGRFVSRN